MWYNLFKSAIETAEAYDFSKFLKVNGGVIMVSMWNPWRGRRKGKEV